MRLVCNAWLLLGIVPAFALGQPTLSKDDQIRDCITAYSRATFQGGSSGGGISPRKRAELADEMMDRLQPDSLTAEQLLRLTTGAGLLREYSKRRDVVVRLEKMSETGDVHGAAAAFALASLKPESGATGPDGVANMAGALKHPGVAKLAPTVAVGDAMNVLTGYLMSHENAAGLLLPELTAFFNLDLGLAITPNLNVFLDTVDRAALTPSQLDPLRTAMQGAIKRCRPKLDDKEAVIDAAVAIGNSRTQIKGMDTQEFRPHLAAQLDTAERKIKGSFGGRVVDQPAPTLDLKWVQAPLEATDAAQLKGRVRVFVKWWRFGPDANSGTPFIKQLSERYTGKPVDIIAVTEFLEGPLFMGGKQIDPGGTREQQVDAIIATAQKYGIAGPIAVVDEKRFGAAFGLQWANSAVVVDASGVVRATKLDGSDPAATFRVIDGLLAPSEPAKP